MVHLKKILLFSLTYCYYSSYILKGRPLFNVWRCLQKHGSGIFKWRFSKIKTCSTCACRQLCRESVQRKCGFYGIEDLQFKTKYAFKTRFYLNYQLFLYFKIFYLLNNDDRLIAYNCQSTFSPRVQYIFSSLTKAMQLNAERNQNAILGTNHIDLSVHFYAHSFEFVCM